MRSPGFCGVDRQSGWTDRSLYRNKIVIKESRKIGKTLQAKARGMELMKSQPCRDFGLAIWLPGVHRGSTSRIHLEMLQNLETKRCRHLFSTSSAVARPQNPRAINACQRASNPKTKRSSTTGKRDPNVILGRELQKTAFRGWLPATKTADRGPEFCSLLFCCKLFSSLFYPWVSPILALTSSWGPPTGSYLHI